MTRPSAFVPFLALTLAPAPAAAQFIPAPGQGAPGSPAYPVTPYRFQPYVGVPVNSIYGRFTAGQQIPFYSPLNNVTNIPFSYWYVRPGQAAAAAAAYPSYGSGSSSGYLSGGVVRNDVVRNAQRDLERAQRDATAARLRVTPDAAKNLIYDQWAYEKLGVFGLPDLKGGDRPEELAKALAAEDESELVSGEALNHVLVAAVAAEGKGGKGMSAFLPPQVLDDVRFSGSPAADALNLIRRAGSLPFPAAFDDPRLKDVRAALEKDFAAAAAPLRGGKPADPGALAKVGVTLGKAQQAATPVIQDLPFGDATAARRFLNRFEAGLGAMRAASAPGLVNPAWAGDGAGVADLVRHMTRHKLLFGAAPPEGGAAYVAVHRALVTYLASLAPKK